MKICVKCNENKDLSEFYKQADRKNGQSYCKSCFNNYCIQRWIDKKKFYVDYMGGRCKDCSYDKHYAAMQFHHINPKTKLFSWNSLRLKSDDKIKAELKKCVLLCANCHAIRHSNSPTYLAD